MVCRAFGAGVLEKVQACCQVLLGVSVCIMTILASYALPLLATYIALAALCSVSFCFGLTQLPYRHHKSDMKPEYLDELMA